MAPDQKAKRMETQKAYRSRKKPIELAISEFHDIASEVPVYICFCCNQLWYKQSVLNAKKLKDLNPVIHEYLEEKRRTDTAEWVCKTCHNHLVKNKIPPCAVVNGLVFPQKPTFFYLNELECRLLAPRIAFQKLMQAPRGKQLKTHGNIVNFRSVKPCEVKDRLKKLKLGKAMGWDLIPPKALKSGASELAVPLANLFNICIKQGYWPTDWKKGEWTPVHKKDDQLQKENYRPVTVQIVINKIFQQLLSSQITGHYNDRLCDHLTAYRKRHSCETVLLYLTESWRHSLDNGECVGVLSTDMSKAFDCLFPTLMLA